MPRILTLIVPAILALGLTAPASVSAQAERDPSAVGREVERALGQSHQRELPGYDLRPDAPGDPVARERELERLERMRREHRDPRTGRPRDPGDRASSQSGAPEGPLSGVATMLLWGLVIVIAIMIGVAIVQQVMGHNRDVEPDAPRAATDLQLAAVIERPRDDADELAAQGRFADAIHTLLLRTLHELASQNLVRVTAAMTSREILGRVSLLGDAREALTGLIVAVEQTWFGDDVPQLADYQRCREQFDRFATAYRRGAGTRS